MSTAKDIFDMSLNLKMHETLLLPVYDKRQQESLRVSLSYNRRTFVDNTTADFDILIGKVKNEKKLFVSLTKVPRITSGIIISPDGNVREASLKNKFVPLSDLDSNNPSDEARMKEAMREDGYSEEEITDFLNSSNVSINDNLLECYESENEKSGDKDEEKGV